MVQTGGDCRRRLDAVAKLRLITVNRVTVRLNKKQSATEIGDSHENSSR
jgi:hypothetical protein